MNKLLYTIAFCFVINLAFAQQETSFRVEVSSDSILLGNYFEVKFLLKNASGSQFEPPSFEGFKVVGGPNHASSFSIANGKASQSMSFTYYLEPQDIGFFYIEPASIKVGDEILETMPKKVLVVANPDEIYQAPDSNKMEDSAPPQEAAPKSRKPKKKRKIYKI